MPHEEQSEWPSFETVLREVAPDSPSIRDGEVEPPRAPAATPETSSATSEIVADPDIAEIDMAGIDMAGSESAAAQLPDLSEPLELDTSSIRELLRSRTTASSFGSTEDLAALEPLPEVLDLDNPAPGDLISDDDDAVVAGHTQPPAPSPAQIEAAPPPPVLSTPEPDPAEEVDADEVGVDVEARSTFSFEHSADLDSAEPLNPFDPEFQGIAEEVVEDDGWVTHSLHDIGVEIVEEPSPQTAPPPPAADEPVETGLEAEPVEPFDPLARMTSRSPFDPPEADPEPPLLTELPPPPSENPFADLLPEEAAPTFDVSGLFTPEDAPVDQHVEIDEFPARTELEPTEPVQTSATPLDLSGLDDAIVFEEVAQPPAPADQLIDFEQYRPTDSGDDSDPLAAWNVQHEAEIIPLNPPDASVPSAPTPPHPERPSTENLFHIDSLAVPDSDAPPEDPRPRWVSLDAEVPPPPPPPARSPEEVADPWAEMRPNEVPEKISFWENRPKFFGGDERRKARARREARQVLEESGTEIPKAHSCPNCGGPCRVDVEDPSTARTHVSCEVCGHMWVEDAGRR